MSSCSFEIARPRAVAYALSCVPKIVIDLRMVQNELHGIARYALELARRLPRLDPSTQYFGLTGPKGVPENLGELKPHLPLIKCSAEFLSPMEQPALAAALLMMKPDLFHATSFSLPAFWRGRLVATIHDANHLALPESQSLARAAYYRLVVVPRALKAEAVITVSAFSRGELTKHLGLPGDKIDVISNGVDAAFCAPSPQGFEEFRVRRVLPTRYFAAIGNRKPCKNLRVLLPIADRLPAPLVLLAGRGARRSLGFPESVLELSPLPDEDLVRFYAGACAVLVPSKYEGFGLPALEAMACGAPVVASNGGANAEVIQDAGLLVSPDVPSEWLSAARRLHSDAGLRDSLREKGRRRACQFSWDDCARRTLEVYRRALEVQK
jgi:glycosyltransferase involved in cell wall biosynthesis